MTKTKLTAKGRIATTSEPFIEAMQSAVSRNVANIVGDTALAAALAQDAERATLEAEVEAIENHADITAMPTVETITAAVQKAMDGLASVFVEMELRRRADNGKLYPVNATLPGEVEDTGELEMVNSLAAMQRNLLSVVPWKLENMIEFAEAKAADQARLIQSYRQQERRSGVDLTDRIGNAERWRETYEYQAALAELAFRAASDMHLELIGEEFETKAMRQARKRAVERAAAPKPVASEHAARMARLGR